MRFEKVSKAQYRTSADNGYENIKIPVRATKGSAGYDIVTPVKFVVKAGQSTPRIPTGLRCQIDEGYVLMTFVRSSVGEKGLTLTNGTGIIDSDYYNAKNEGHIMFSLYNRTGRDIVIEAGERILQGVFVPYGVVDGDSADKEREGGFGSTNDEVISF